MTASQSHPHSARHRGMISSFLSKCVFICPPNCCCIKRRQHSHGSYRGSGPVVQLLDFGIKLVSKAHHIYNSPEGSGVHNIELDVIAQNLISVNRRLHNRYRKVCGFCRLRGRESRA
ncbi:hypothetical protein I7I48_07118 [Histoplasma ohiense]|nr:hypothetical protein I7I48_07118 [Histoplasma ohiense (nom. inval.)]